jgi:hypothetical protein
VRVCAPLELRIERMMERLNTDDRVFVTNEILLADEAHSAITRRHFGINWQEAENYDLVLNTERVTIPESVDEIMSLVGDPQFQETRESMRTFNNLALQSHLRAALRYDPRTTNMRITATADDGQVTLSGILDADLDAKDALEVISEVQGVKNIKNELKLAASSRIMPDS